MKAIKPSWSLCAFQVIEKLLSNGGTKEEPIHSLNSNGSIDASKYGHKLCITIWRLVFMGEILQHLLHLLDWILLVPPYYYYYVQSPPCSNASIHISSGGSRETGLNYARNWTKDYPNSSQTCSTWFALELISNFEGVHVLLKLVSR